MTRKVTAPRATRAVVNALAAGEVLLEQALRLLQQALRLLTPPPGADPDTWELEPRALAAATGALDKAVMLQRVTLGLPTGVTRQDVMVKEAQRQNAEVSAAFIDILQTQVCERCKPGVLAALTAVKERIEQMREHADG